MTLYVRSVGANITFVDVDEGMKFTVAPVAVQRLLGVEVNEGQVWDIAVQRREGLEVAFNKWQAVQRA